MPPKKRVVKASKKEVKRGNIRVTAKTEPISIVIDQRKSSKPRQPRQAQAQAQPQQRVPVVPTQPISYGSGAPFGSAFTHPLLPWMKTPAPFFGSPQQYDEYARMISQFQTQPRVNPPPAQVGPIQAQPPGGGGPPNGRPPRPPGGPPQPPQGPPPPPPRPPQNDLEELRRQARPIEPIPVLEIQEGIAPLNPLSGRLFPKEPQPPLQRIEPQPARILPEEEPIQFIEAPRIENPVSSAEDITWRPSLIYPINIQPIAPPPEDDYRGNIKMEVKPFKRIPVESSPYVPPPVQSDKRIGSTIPIEIKYPEDQKKREEFQSILDRYDIRREQGRGVIVTRKKTDEEKALEREKLAQITMRLEAEEVPSKIKMPKGFKRHPPPPEIPVSELPIERSLATPNTKVRDEYEYRKPELPKLSDIQYTNPSDIPAQWKKYRQEQLLKANPTFDKATVTTIASREWYNLRDSNYPLYRLWYTEFRVPQQREQRERAKLYKQPPK